MTTHVICSTQLHVGDNIERPMHVICSEKKHTIYLRVDVV